MCFTFVIVAIVDVMKQIQSHETHDFDERRRSRVSIRRSFVAAAARDPGTRRAGGVVGSFTTRDQCPLTTSFVRSFVGRGRGWLVCRSSVGRSCRSVGRSTHSLGRSTSARRPRCRRALRTRARPAELFHSWRHPTATRDVEVERVGDDDDVHRTTRVVRLSFVAHERAKEKDDENEDDDDDDDDDANANDDDANANDEGDDESHARMARTSTNRTTATK